MKKLLIRTSVILLWIAVSGCGGTKVLKEPEPLVLEESLAAASDERLSVSLDWVIVRDGPGTWAKNSDWDEYLIRLRNKSGDSLRISSITIVDSLGARVESGTSRKQLVKESKKASRRYKDEGLEIQAGAGGATLILGGAAAAVAVGGGAAVAATGLLLAAPVLVVGGVFRGVNYGKVNKQIEIRQTRLPIVLQKEEEKSLDIFFPLTPSPRLVEISYTDFLGDHTLIIDTQVVLEDLHLVRAEE